MLRLALLDILPALPVWRNASAAGLAMFHPEALAEAARCFPAKAIRTSCVDSRAAATMVRAMDAADHAAGRRIGCPVLVLHGGKSHAGQVFDDAAAVWRDAALDVQGEALACGHSVPEHAPEHDAGAVLGFFGAQPA